MTIINNEGCLELMAAIINPNLHLGRGGRKRLKQEEVLPELGEEWADLAAGILDIDEEVVRKEVL